MHNKSKLADVILEQVVKVILQQAASPPHMDGSIIFARWRLIRASLDLPESKSKPHLDRFSLFCTVPCRAPLYFTMGRPYPSKLLLTGDLLSGTCYYRDVGSMRETLPFIRAVAGDTSSSTHRVPLTIQLLNAVVSCAIIACNNYYVARASGCEVL